MKSMCLICPCMPVNVLLTRRDVCNVRVSPRAALCFKSAATCNAAFSKPRRCVADTSTCASGFAGGYADNIWISPQDPAYITGKTTIQGLPNGGGLICFLNHQMCNHAMEGFPHALSRGCVNDISTCSTGQAGPTEYNIISTVDKPSPNTGLPTGAGITCFHSKLACETNNGNPCKTPTVINSTREIPCFQDFMTCSSG
jgi:hypothetical protein